MLAGIALAGLAPVACLGRLVGRKGNDPKTGQNGLLRSAWDNMVTFAPDPSRGGAVMPGLSGRVYLFNSDVKNPYIGDGWMSIALFDATPRGNSEPRVTDIFDIDPETLRKFAKTDFVGDGYTIFFPWFNYKPDVTNAYIIVKYESPTRGNFSHQSGTFNVDHSEARLRARKGLAISHTALN